MQPLDPVAWRHLKTPHWGIVYRIISPFSAKMPSFIKLVNSKGNRPWTDAEAEAPILWHLMRRANSLAKTLMLGKNEGRKWRRWQSLKWLDGISSSMDEFEQALGDGEGQGSLVCCSAWGRKELGTTEWLNNNNDEMVIFSKNCFYWIMSFRETWNISKLYL